jgi:hypothetical protein
MHLKHHASDYRSCTHLLFMTGRSGCNNAHNTSTAAMRFVQQKERSRTSTSPPKTRNGIHNILTKVTVTLAHLKKVVQKSHMCQTNLSQHKPGGQHLRPNDPRTAQHTVCLTHGCTGQQSCAEITPGPRKATAANTGQRYHSPGCITTAQHTPWLKHGCTCCAQKAPNTQQTAAITGQRHRDPGRITTAQHTPWLQHAVLAVQKYHLA